MPCILLPHGCMWDQIAEVRGKRRLVHRFLHDSLYFAVGLAKSTRNFGTEWLWNIQFSTCMTMIMMLFMFALQQWIYLLKLLSGTVRIIPNVDGAQSISLGHSKSLRATVVGCSDGKFVNVWCNYTWVDTKHITGISVDFALWICIYIYIYIYIKWIQKMWMDGPWFWRIHSINLL